MKVGSTMNLTPEMLQAAAAAAEKGARASELIDRAVAAAQARGYDCVVWVPSMMRPDGRIHCRKRGVSLLLAPVRVFGSAELTAELEAAFAAGLLQGFRFS